MMNRDCDDSLISCLGLASGETCVQRDRASNSNVIRSWMRSQETKKSKQQIPQLDQVAGLLDEGCLSRKFPGFPVRARWID